MNIQICISNSVINYNRWITLPATKDELKELIDIMGKFSGYYRISDYTGPLNINPNDNIFALDDFVSDLDELYERGQLATIYLIDVVGLSREEALEKQEDVQVWQDSDLEDVAHELIEGGVYGKIPDSITYYIDYEKIAKELRMSQYYYDEEQHCVYYYN